MRVQTSRTPLAVAEVRRRAWRETGWTLLCAVVAGLAVAVAARGVESVPAALLWLLAGGSLADTLTAGARAGRAWARWRRSTRCAVCRDAQVQASDGQSRQQICAGSGHAAVSA